MIKLYQTVEYPQPGAPSKVEILTLNREDMLNKINAAYHDVVKFKTRLLNALDEKNIKNSDMIAMQLAGLAYWKL